MTWADVAVAGAFVLGLVGGALVTIRITRYVLEYLRNERDSRSE